MTSQVSENKNLDIFKEANSKLMHWQMFAFLRSKLRSPYTEQERAGQRSWEFRAKTGAMKKKQWEQC